MRFSADILRERAACCSGTVIEVPNFGWGKPRSRETVYVRMITSALDKMQRMIVVALLLS
jgi:hypothetical protein